MRPLPLAAFTLLAAFGAGRPAAAQAPATPATPATPVPAPAPATPVPAPAPAPSSGPDAGAAPPVSQAQAERYLQQYLAWERHVSGNPHADAARPPQLEAEGDHYLLRLPVTVPNGTTIPPGATMTARLRPLDATRWSAEDITWPDHLTMTQPRPGGSQLTEVKLGKQDIHGTFDTANTQPTHFAGTIASATLGTSDPVLTAAFNAGQIGLDTTARPVGAGHFDLTSTLDAADGLFHGHDPSGFDMEFGAKTVHVEVAASNLAYEQMMALNGPVSALQRLQNAPHAAQPTPGAEERVQINRMVELLRNLLNGAHVVERGEGIRFTVHDGQGHDTAGTMASAELVFDASAPQSLLTLGVGVSMDGLQVPNLPPPIADFLPSHFKLHQTLSNIDAARLTREATASALAGPGHPPPSPQALFGPNGVQVAVDTVELTMAGAAVTGSGTLSLKPGLVTGTGDLQATGLDQLVTRMQTNPMLAQGAAAVIFLKGIAHTEGDHAVWHITSDGQKVLVNGVDLSQMAGAFSH